MDFIEALEKEIGQKAKKEFLPLQPGDVPDTFANVDDLIKDFDFKPKTSVQVGIKNFVDWYFNYFKVNRR